MTRGTRERLLAWALACAAAGAADAAEPTARGPMSTASAPAASVPATTPAPWGFAVTGALYRLPDEADFVQPTVRVDRGRWHVEARYQYEDRESVSLFGGTRFETGETVRVTLLPMFGGLAGRSDGMIPALEADVTAGRLEFYGEAEHVFVFDEATTDYFYMWSELGFRAREWLRAGVVAQRTRLHASGREIQRGFLVGGTLARLDGTLYLFNPGSGDRYAVVSIGLEW